MGAASYVGSQSARTLGTSTAVGNRTPGAGNDLILVLLTFTASAAISQVSASAVGATVITDVPFQVDSLSGVGFGVYRVHSAAASLQTITAVFTGSVSCWALLVEANSVGMFDTAMVSILDGNSKIIATNSLEPSQSGALVIAWGGAAHFVSSAAGWTDGFTSVVSSISGPTALFSYLNQAAPAAVAPSNTVGSQVDWAALIVSYVPVAGTSIAGEPFAVSNATSHLTTHLPLSSISGSVKSARSALFNLMPRSGGTSVKSAKASLAAANALPAAGARSRHSTAAALTNWTSVTLASPLYGAPGSIVDPSAAWSAGAPVAGDTVYYDGTNMTVLADGEIIANPGAAYIFLAQVQWRPSAGVASELTIEFTQGPISFSSAKSIGISSALTSALILGSHSKNSSQATAVLSSRTGASVVSSSDNVSRGVSSLATQIRFVSSARSRSAGSSEPTTGVAFESMSAQRQASRTAFTTHPSFASRSGAVALTHAAATTVIAAKSVGRSVSTGGAIQLERVFFTSAGRSISAAASSLLTAKPISSRSASVSAAGSAVTSAEQLVSRSASSSSGVGTPATDIALKSNAAAVTSAPLFQYIPVRFGYSILTVESGTSEAPAGSPVTIIAGTACFVSAKWFDADGNQYVPLSVSYSVQDVTSGDEIASPVTLIPSVSNLVSVTSAQNAMVNVSRDSELHQVLFQITDQLGETFYRYAAYEVMRIVGAE